jgi:nickel-type superoxide dismutase maturation protease
MEPLIKSGETVLVSSVFYWFKKPKIGDIVAFRDKEAVLIKRITKVDKGKYFLEGDNKKDSLDSRKLGLISRDKILGEIIYRL